MPLHGRRSGDPRASVEGRSDDREDVIRHRIRRFNADVQPLLDHYRRQGTLRPVDGAGEPDAVFHRILQALA